MENPSTLPRHWKRNFYQIFGGQFISGITSFIVQYVLIWHLTQTTGDPKVLALATAMGFLPYAFLSPFVGPLIDRMNKKILMIASDALVALTALVLFVAGIHQELPIWLIFASLFLRAIGQTFQQPTLQSIIPTIVEEDFVTAANGQIGSFQSLQGLIAPVIGLVIQQNFPVNQAMLLDLIGALAGTLTVLFADIPSFIKKTKLDFVNEFKEGMRELRVKKGVFYMTLISGVGVLLYMPAMSLFPLMTTKFFKMGLGNAVVVDTLWSLGMLAGGLMAGLFGKVKNRATFLLLAYATMGAVFAISGILPRNSTGFWIFVGINMLAGVAAMLSNAFYYAMVQQSFEPDKLGRIFSVVTAINTIAGPIGLLFAAPGSELVGVNGLFIIAGVGVLLITLVACSIKVVRRMDPNLLTKE